MNKRIKIAYIPTRRSNFSVEEAIRYKKIIRRQIDQFDIEIADIEDINEEGLLLRQTDVPRVTEKMKQEKVDAVFFPHCNFGSEGVVGQVAAALKVPVLLYGPRDDAPDEEGMRSRDSQCGLFATGKVLRRHNVPFTYITNVTPNDPVFLNGFEKFIRVVCVVKTMKQIRVLQIGPRPGEFLSVMANESELMELFGIEVFPVALPELKQEMERCAEEEKEKVCQIEEYMLKKYKGPGVEREIPRKTLAKMKLAVRNLAEQYRCNCACIQCWPAMQEELEIFPCAVNSMLADEGFPVACETDILGAVSALMVQAATGNRKPHFLADLTVRHPTEENVELLWHCGAFPSAFAKDKDNCRITEAWDGKPQCGNCSWELENGDITICRFDGDHGRYSLFLGEGKGIDGPKSKGTYVWFQVDNWPKWEHKLVQGPYIHHVAGTYGKVADVLVEACRYLENLNPDPASPSLDELIERYRR